ncbi:response regulator [Deinococcus yavapaiensis]|uniref:Response regulator receiver domain-containing protein n=1 Tax=Deinococcus yavapaiensis KR-236 TaxID=694435 RepID=A0A318SA97_9DEIO|nr:response regulator [Deinococcus yavapaiensis]PYE53154.1 response regulator receiver domain-containing protein [Deinococcus yavapaiensis KR-236]
MESKPSVVLFIDDNDADSILLREAFASVVTPRASILLRVEDDGTAGLKVARQLHPDLILLDLTLPDVDGLDVLQALKSDEATRHIPVIVYSERGSEERIRRAYELHANAYVRKSVTFEELCWTIDTLSRFWLTTAKLPGEVKRAALC